eukprot:TRINITY_DN5767_c0_g1_i18.p1 TRINITY_DN5767_c0_g1~~TRINITY_DN5767_c0_g1_i18.p1  ORF type:complete len:346 (-),score=22.70 TRINITY_DN5767_c0_g1_i18:755-1792(-)
MEQQKPTSYDETWGPDFEDNTVNSFQEGQGQVGFSNSERSGKTKYLKVTEYLERERKEQLKRKQSQKTEGQIPSLQSYCLGVFADNLDEILSLDREAVQCIPPNCRACLFAVARFQEKASSKVLNLLLDESWNILDIHNCSHLSTQQIIQALEQMPRIAYLDLSRCGIDPALIRSLGQICPMLRVLRLNFCQMGSMLQQSIIQALTRILPGQELRRMQQKDQQLGSWEELFEGSTDSDKPSGVCEHLEYLVAPGISAHALHQLYHLCPKLKINVEDPDLEQADGKIALEQSLLDNVAGDWAAHYYQLQRHQEGQTTKEISIAEKFRLAIIAVRGRQKAPRKVFNI